MLPQPNFSADAIIAEEDSSSKAKGLGKDAPAALGVDEQEVTSDTDDDDDWEYEYSSTETETYYLTIDLTCPEFKTAATTTPHHSRGGYYKKWLEQRPIAPVSKTKPVRTNEPLGQEIPRSTSIRVEDGGNNVNDPTQEVEEDLSHIDPLLLAESANMVREEASQKALGKRPDYTGVRERNRASEEEEDQEGDVEQTDAVTTAPLEDIQILNLHSKRPVISYRGLVFEGQWAEMIGTDMVLAQHEAGSEDELPALLKLSDGVSFLAASASRILTTKKTLKPKAQTEDTLEPIRKEWNINIPHGKGKDSERTQQINFLERLMALKIKKGETDKVTVYAKEAIGKDFHDDRDHAPRTRRKRNNVRVEEADIDNDSATPVRQKRRRSAKVSVRARSSAPRTTKGTLHRSEHTRGLSEPTPKRWEDLKDENGDQDDLNESDARVSDEEVSDENNDQNKPRDDEGGQEGGSNDDDEYNTAMDID